MNKNIFTLFFWLNIVLFATNLYLGYTTKKFNYFAMASNLLFAVGMYLLSKKK